MASSCPGKLKDSPEGILPIDSLEGVIHVLDPIKTIVNPHNERLPDRRNPRRDRKKRMPGGMPNHHLQEEPTGEKIDVTA